MSKKFFNFLIFFNFWILFVSCTTKVDMPKEAKITELSHLLHSLDSAVLEDEADRLSLEIYYQTARLSHKFKMTSPPQYHNFLVNIGAREKGLCYHWSDALYNYFKQQEYLSFSFHLMGAYIGEYWREHNAFLVSAKGKSVQEGIIIDPWRYGGKLYFSKVSEDDAYSWVHRPSRGCTE